MKFQMATRQTAEAKMSSDAEVTDLPSDPRGETAPLVPEVGACTIAEFEKLIGELQETKTYLQSEGERIQKETAHYTNVAQTASASVKIISDTVREWREAGRPPVSKARSSTPEITRAAKENLTPKCVKEARSQDESDGLLPSNQDLSAMTTGT